MKSEKIKEEFSRHDLSLSDAQAERFRIYHEEIVRWNVRANLISKNDVNRIVARHFVESAALSRFEEFSGDRTILDLGAGGGFPGVPLKIVCPHLDLVLLDSKRWKALFLKSLIAKLDLEAEVVCERAEVLAEQEKYRSRFDIVVSRAVAPLSDLIHWGRPLLSENGVLVTIKGSSVQEEILEMESDFPGWQIETRVLFRDSVKTPVVVFLSEAARPLNRS